MNKNRWKETVRDGIALISEKNSYFKSLLLSSLLGFSFGIIVLTLVFMGGERPTLFLFTIPIFCGVLSGLAGMSGDFLDRQLLKRGIEGPLKRRLLSFGSSLLLVVVIMVFLNSNVVGLFYAGPDRMLWGILGGAIFGVVVVVVEYNYWKLKQKMLILELENKYLEELASKDMILKEATKNLVLTRERNRMARELHDSICQGMHGIIYCISSLRQQLKRSEGQENKLIEIIDQLEKTAEGSMAELRSMIEELKPVLLEKNSLGEALYNHCQLFSRRQQIPVELELSEIEFLSPEQEFAIFRIIQEALANVQKHAQASRIDITLYREVISERKTRAVLMIKDNGRGFDPKQVLKGNGLDNMALRSQENGGIFDLFASPGKGTVIRVIFKG